MNISMDEFYEMNKDHMITAEDAALGFALSVLHASTYNGREIRAIQVLHGIEK